MAWRWSTGEEPGARGFAKGVMCKEKPSRIGRRLFGIKAYCFICTKSVLLRGHRVNTFCRNTVVRILCTMLSRATIGVPLSGYFLLKYSWLTVLLAGGSTRCRSNVVCVLIYCSFDCTFCLLEVRIWALLYGSACNSSIIMRTMPH